MKSNSIVFNEIESFIIKDFLRGDLICMNNGETMSWYWNLKDHSPTFFLFSVPSKNNISLKEQTLSFIENNALYEYILSSLERRISEIEQLDEQSSLEAYESALEEISKY